SRQVTAGHAFLVVAVHWLKHGRYGIDGGLVDVVEQQHAARGGFVPGDVDDLVTVVVLPVQGVHVPQHYGVVNGLTDGVVQCPVRRPYGHGVLADDVVDGPVGTVEVVLDRVGGGRSQVGVPPGVTADLVTVHHHAFDLVLVLVHLGTEKVEGGLGVVFAKDVQEAVGVLPGPVVEGQRHAIDLGAVGWVRLVRVGRQGRSGKDETTDKQCTHGRFCDALRRRRSNVHGWQCKASVSHAPRETPVQWGLMEDSSCAGRKYEHKNVRGVGGW